MTSGAERRLVNMRLIQPAIEASSARIRAPAGMPTVDPVTGRERTRINLFGAALTAPRRARTYTQNSGYRASRDHAAFTVCDDGRIPARRR
jgi:hypothetical protein